MIKQAMITLALMVCIFANSAQAQDDEDDKEKKSDEWKENIFFGGNLGASFGTTTYLRISPTIGYRFTDRFSLGVRGNYEYFKAKDWEFSIYGGGVFSRYVVFRNLYAHAEYNPLNVQKFTSSERMWIHGVLVGGGYRQPIGKKGYAHIELLYDLNETIYTPYDNPMIRVGVTF